MSVAYEPSAQAVEDYNAISAPRCPKCGGRIRFDYVTDYPDGLQFRCMKCRRSIWMVAPKLDNEV